MGVNKKNIAILGSTGSIGTQALDVIRKNREKLQVSVLSAENSVELLIKQASEFLPKYVVIGNKEHYDQLKTALVPKGIKVFTGATDLADVVKEDGTDIVLTAMVGYSGLLPTLNAINSGKHIALANKETLVVAGELVTEAAERNKISILPVDSEHSAIFQCMVGEELSKIEKVILTASGGPFRGKSKDFLLSVKKADALKHPNWSMGAKITIDSASLMNKGLEVIEAKWLFDLTAEQIDVVIHPQSIVHSMVQFTDGSIKAQMGLPDMKLPIQYAVFYPERVKSDFPRFNFTDYPSLTFEKPDVNTFRNLGLAFDALKKGGNMPCILNAANEIAVKEFLNENIGFLEISDIIEDCMAKVPYIARPNLEDLIQTDEETRRLAKTIKQKA
ncbi:MAG: 1-deoxy-D-xylulose-5-phosphate reductoisomerase [Cytophagaceae bacterium]